MQVKKPFTPPVSRTMGGLKIETLEPRKFLETKKSSEPKEEWWVDMALPVAEIGDSGASVNQWAYAHMLHKALQGKKTLYKGSASGYVGNETHAVAKAIEALLPGFAIEKSVQAKGDHSNKIIFVWDEGYASLRHWDMDSEISVDICCTDKDLVQKIIRQIGNNIIPRKSQGRVYVIGSGMNGPQFYSLGVASVKLDRGNYSAKTLKAYDHVVDDLSSVSPCGRLAIFDGLPGSGKTFLIRAILEDVEKAMFVLVPPEMMGMLSSPELIPMLLRKKSMGGDGGPIIFILEDADNLLTPRDNKNLSLISSLLNFSSGMLGSMLDIRAIATTNSDKKDIDSALMRPGRLCRQVTIGPLSSKQALSVIKRLTKSDKAVIPKDLDDSSGITLAQAYRAARDQGWRPTGDMDDAERKRRYGDHSADTESPLSIASEGIETVNSREFGEDFQIHHVIGEVDLLS